MDFYGFYTGKVFDAYRYLGGHLTEAGAVFRTFAPAAEAISVIGDFNGWQETPMERVYDGNFWSCEIPGARAGIRYKYRIRRRDGVSLDHCDPYGFSMELRPHNASILRELPGARSQDGGWRRRSFGGADRPLNIYEVHLGSWRRKAEDPNGWYRYDELAELLIPYVKEAGYNCIEVLPLSEHPSDASWGYQNTGFFSATSRYGTPEELITLVDRCHQAGLGVILDFVPVHFAVDDYALWNYDGTALYEYPSWDVGRSQWGSCNFMHSRGEVRSFLQSAAHFWLEEYHFDGLRMDAVRNLIYWQGEEARGENQGGLQFLREMNRGLKALHPDALLIAEDSSAWPGVTAPVEQGGLGFDYKWDMGWMHDTLSYFQTPPADRPAQGRKLTFSMDYVGTERYLLPLSHDEVVHGKATILQKMHGGYEEKFHQARALYLYMLSHPGKKLNFMGNEIGHFREWDESREQDWNLMDYPAHQSFFRFVQTLNRIYLDTPALWKEDYRPEGFQWLAMPQGERGVFAFLRRGGGQCLLAVFNFLDQEAEAALPIPDGGRLELLLDSGEAGFGGTGGPAEQTVPVERGRAALTLPPYCGRWYLLK